MRHLLAIALVVATPALAAPCLQEAKLHYKEYGQTSDTPLNFRLVSQPHAQTLVFEITGSYHSGWFSDEMVLDKTSCSVQSLRNTYSE
jgi:hypothetical protein